jgi:hypothetical protein
MFGCDESPGAELTRTETCERREARAAQWSALSPQVVFSLYEYSWFHRTNDPLAHF